MTNEQLIAVTGAQLRTLFKQVNLQDLDLKGLTEGTLKIEVSLNTLKKLNLCSELLDVRAYSEEVIV